MVNENPTQNQQRGLCFNENAREDEAERAEFLYNQFSLMKAFHSTTKHQTSIPDK